MANLDVQIQALVGTATQSEMDDWATDGAKEIINILPLNLKEKCTTETTLNNSSPTMDLDGTGSILYVTRLSADSGGKRIPCRKMLSMYAEMANDSNSMYYASVTDPAYWISSSNDVAILSVLPTPTANQTAIVYHVGYPTVDVSAGSSIANFPDEAEYLVVLYTSIKVLQNKMNEMVSNSDTATALTAVNTELDETQAVCDLINTQVDSAVTEIAKAVTEAGEMVTQTDNSGDFETALDAINTAVDKFRADGGDPALFGDDSTYHTSNSEMTRVKDALDLARDAIDTGFTTDEDSGGSDDATPKSVGYWLDDEDTEMVQATLQTAQTEIQRAQAHIAEWNATVQALQVEINGFATEVQSRAAFTGAKGQTVQSIIAEASGYINAAQGYGGEIQSKIGIAQGYIAEANARMQKDAQEYQFYQSQQVKLQQDYDKGVKMLVAPYQSAQITEGENNDR